MSKKNMNHVLSGYHQYGPAGEFRLEGHQTLGRIGVPEPADIAVPSWIVSGRHGEFFTEGDSVRYRDTGSSNGTWLNQELVTGEVILKDGDVLYFAPRGMGSEDAVFRLEYSQNEEDTREQLIAPLTASEGTETVRLTREQIAAICGLWKEKGVEPVHVDPSDSQPDTTPEEVQTSDGWTERSIPEGLPGLDIDIEERSVKQLKQKRILLKDIHLRLEPGEFLLVLGGSGAGKSTFMKAVMGYEPADGTITYGDLDVYRDYEQMKYQIGFVSQKDLLRDNDTVYDTLMSAAQMKLPDRGSREEAERRIWEAMEILGIADEEDNMVGRLSGGQKKRLSIAMELVGDPALFFLDEPDSGLDGVLARELMENLRTIADMGKMVMIITHGPDRAADLFTRVLVLGKTEKEQCGRMVYYGPPEEAKDFFGVAELEQIVRKVSRQAEGGEGLTEYYMEKFEKMQKGGGE